MISKIKIQLRNIKKDNVSKMAMFFLGDMDWSIEEDDDEIIEVSIGYNKNRLNRIIDFVNELKSSKAKAFDTEDCLTTIYFIPSSEIEDFVLENTQIFRKLAQLNTPRWNRTNKCGVFRATLNAKTLVAQIQLVEALIQNKQSLNSFDEFYMGLEKKNIKQYINKKIYGGE